METSYQPTKRLQLITFCLSTDGRSSVENFCFLPSDFRFTNAVGARFRSDTFCPMAVSRQSQKMGTPSDETWGISFSELGQQSKEGVWL
jgi:hypothetical protein